MTVQHNAVLMRIYFSESSRYHGKTLHRAIVEALLERGISGAISFKGIAGYGSHGRVSSERTVDAVVDLPIVVEAVDDEATLVGFLGDLERMLLDGLVTLERIQRVVHRTGPAG